MELKLTVDGLEKERDFYFGKLRDIELICQEPESENHPILSKIMDILYATEVPSITHPSTPNLQSSVCLKTIFRPFTLALSCLICRRVLHLQRMMTLKSKLTWARMNTDHLASLPPESSIFSFLFLFDLISFLICTLHKYSLLSPTRPPSASSCSFCSWPSSPFALWLSTHYTQLLCSIAHRSSLPQQQCQTYPS